ELWKSDGTAAGTTRVADINAGPDRSDPDQFTELGGVLYFHATDGAHGRELWKYDGATVALVLDILAGPQSSLRDTAPSSMVVAGGLLFFPATDSSHGEELWRSDGTAAGSFVLDLDPGPSGGFGGPLTALGSRVLFAGYVGGIRLSPYVSDGTLAGTLVLKD